MQSFRYTSHLVAQFLFTWVQPLITISQAQKLQPEQMFPLPENMQALRLMKLFQISWDRVTTSRSHKLMFHALHDMIFRPFWIAGAYRFFSDVLVIMCAFMTKYIVQAVNSGNTESVFTLAMIYFALSFTQVARIVRFSLSL